MATNVERIQELKSCCPIVFLCVQRSMKAYGTRPMPAQLHTEICRSWIGAILVPAGGVSCPYCSGGFKSTVKRGKIIQVDKGLRIPHVGCVPCYLDVK